MRLRPNDLPEMELGEVRNVTVNVSGAAGANSIQGTPTAECDSLTIGNVSTSGLIITFPVTADKAGTHTILVSANLSSSETVKGFIRAKVVDSQHCERVSDDYRD